MLRECGMWWIVIANLSSQLPSVYSMKLNILAPFVGVRCDANLCISANVMQSDFLARYVASSGYAKSLGNPVIYDCSLEKFEATRTLSDPIFHLSIG